MKLDNSLTEYERINYLKKKSTCYQCYDIETGDIFTDEYIIYEDYKFKIVLDTDPKYKEDKFHDSRTFTLKRKELKNGEELSQKIQEGFIKTITTPCPIVIDIPLIRTIILYSTFTTIHIFLALIKLFNY